MEPIKFWQLNVPGLYLAAWPEVDPYADRPQIPEDVIYRYCWLQYPTQKSAPFDPRATSPVYYFGPLHGVKASSEYSPQAEQYAQNIGLNIDCRGVIKWTKPEPALASVAAEPEPEPVAIPTRSEFQLVTPVDAETEKEAAEIVARLKKLIKQREEYHAPIISKAHETHKAALERKKEEVQKIQDVLDAQSILLIDYRSQQKAAGAPTASVKTAAGTVGDKTGFEFEITDALELMRAIVEGKVPAEVVKLSISKRDANAWAEQTKSRGTVHGITITETKGLGVR